MTYQQPNQNEVKEILDRTKRIAVVGISDKPDRASYQVSAYMQQAGYEIIPINPRIDNVLGVKAYASLQEVEGEIDMVNVFRRSSETPPVAEAAVQAGAKTLWLQLGISNEVAYRLANDAGLNVIMDRCIKIEHADIERHRRLGR
jgi:predicted CoA-binding protein